MIVISKDAHISDLAHPAQETTNNPRAQRRGGQAHPDISYRVHHTPDPPRQHGFGVSSGEPGKGRYRLLAAASGRRFAGRFFRSGFFRNGFFRNGFFRNGFFRSGLNRSRFFRNRLFGRRLGDGGF